MKILLTIQAIFILVSIWLSITLLALRRRSVPSTVPGELKAVSRAGRKAVALLRRAVAVFLVAAIIYFMLMRSFVHLISQ